MMFEGQEPRVAVLPCPSRLASELQASFPLKPFSACIYVKLLQDRRDRDRDRDDRRRERSRERDRERRRSRSRSRDRRR